MALKCSLFDQRLAKQFAIQCLSLVYMVPGYVLLIIDFVILLTPHFAIINFIYFFTL